MKLSLPRWAAAAAICAGLFILADRIAMRGTLPLLLTGFIVGQGIVWLLAPRMSSH
jgi:hypothetical protein